MPSYLPEELIHEFKIHLQSVVNDCDYMKDLKEFNSLGKDIVMRIAIIRTLSHEVIEKLR